MARGEAGITTRTARLKLPTGKRIYWRHIDRETHLGYRRGTTGGRWLVRLYDPVKQGYTAETFATADDRQDADGETVLSFSQAQARAVEIAERQRQETAGKAVMRPWTVNDALSAYHKMMETEGRRSVGDSRQRAALWIAPKIGERLISELTSDELRDWHAEIAASAGFRKGKGGPAQRSALDGDDAKRARRASANRTLTILKAALNHAFTEEKVPSDAAWRRVKPFREVDGARARFLTVDEARRLVNSAEPWFRPMVQAALLTGARYGELAAANVADFDASQATLFVRRSKSGKARHIHLTREGIDLLAGLATGRPGDAPLIPRHDGGRFAKSHQGRPFAAALKRAKIKGVTFHELRHTWATLALMNGAPIAVVAENLGHADTRMVSKHYGHIADHYLRETLLKTAPSFGFAAPASNVTALSG